jgi:type II secretory pathway component GspD/PulD (secretin)
VGDPAEVGPTTTVRSASTAVAARDGQTVVIGGLIADTQRVTTRAVPYLGRIPVLGVLFRFDADLRQKTNLLVFLTPHIIGSDEAMAQHSLHERERMRASLPSALRRQPQLGGRSWRPPAPAPAGDDPPR